ncbi:hypothetical protein ACVW19_005376 [Streptomyces sp. TE5632]
MNACHGALDLLEAQKTPYAVAINTFPDAPAYEASELRQDLALDARIPLTTCDARDRTSSPYALITLTEYLTAPRTAASLESRP